MTTPKPDDVFDIPVCRQCITGEGGECHNPGCSFFIKPAPSEGCNSLGTVCMEIHAPNALGVALGKLDRVEEFSERGVGMDLNPTTLRTPDIGWWLGYLRRVDDQWRSRLAYVLTGK